MNAVPTTIGGAKVIWYTLLDEQHQRTGNTQNIAGDKVVYTIHGLAICQYPLEEGYYLFGCDEHWYSITDTFHDTIEDAKDQAAFEYKNVHHFWMQHT